MNKSLLGLAAIAALMLSTASAEAQWVNAYYAPAYAPVVVAPVRRAYYAPVAYPAYPVATAAYYAPAPAYYAPTTAYYAAPVAAPYYAPAVAAPVVVGSPVRAFYSGYGGPEVRHYGRPIGNTIRTIVP